MRVMMRAKHLLEHTGFGRGFIACSGSYTLQCNFKQCAEIHIFVYLSYKPLYLVS